MTPVAYVQDFAFCLGGPSKFMPGVGSWRSWVLSPVLGESQMSLPGTIFLVWTIQLGVCLQPPLEWSVQQESQSTTGQKCLTHGIPLMTLCLPLWTSFPFLVRRTHSYSPCWKMNIGTRHPQRSQNLPEEFPTGHHTSNPQKMRRKNLPLWTHCQ